MRHAYLFSTSVENFFSKCFFLYHNHFPFPNFHFHIHFLHLKLTRHNSDTKFRHNLTNIQHLTKIQKLSNLASEEMRFISTGTGMFAGQQSSQLLFMETHHPEILNKSKTAFHCKDWIYYKLTGVKGTDPSESCFTFGNFRTQNYDEDVISNLGLNNLGEFDDNKTLMKLQSTSTLKYT